MAPSASMLFLSYHQLHRPAEAASPRRKEKGEAGGARLSLSSVFSLGALARRRETAAPAARDEGKRGRECDAGEEKSAAAELEGKFEEALRLSCWSS